MLSPTDATEVIFTFSTDIELRSKSSDRTTSGLRVCISWASVESITYYNTKSGTLDDTCIQIVGVVACGSLDTMVMGTQQTNITDALHDRNQEVRNLNVGG